MKRRYWAKKLSKRNDEKLGGMIAFSLDAAIYRKNTRDHCPECCSIHQDLYPPPPPCPFTYPICVAAASAPCDLCVAMDPSVSLSYRHQCFLRDPRWPSTTPILAWSSLPSYPQFWMVFLPNAAGPCLPPNSPIYPSIGVALRGRELPKSNIGWPPMILTLNRAAI
jgi:hypothetical protein